MPAPPLNFPLCLFGQWPLVPNKPAIHPFDTNIQTEYAKAVLRCKTGHNLAQNAVFDGAMYWAVRDMQTYFGLPVDGHISTDDWGVVDYLALH